MYYFETTGGKSEFAHASMSRMVENIIKYKSKSLQKLI